MIYGDNRDRLKKSMIELEFIDSPDKDVLGKRVIYFNEVSVGRSQANVIIVDDMGMKEQDIHLIVSESGVFVENREAEHYFSNDKKISGKKLHVAGDRIRAGGTTLKILSFKAVKEDNEDYDSIYQREIQPVPYKDQLFHAIKREMDDLETSQ